jgi:hypothetical protein
MPREVEPIIVHCPAIYVTVATGDTTTVDISLSSDEALMSKPESDDDSERNL